MDKTIKILIAIIFTIPLAMAAIPDTLNIHAKLTDPAGAALTGVFDITFRFYDDPTAGSVLYSVLQTITTDSSGIFTTLLPEVDVVDWDQNTWMELAIEGEVLSPRINTTSVPSAFTGTGSSLWTETGSNIYYNSGDVGILETNPLAPLHVSATSEAAELRIDSPTGIFDSALTFYNGGTKEYDICMDDSVSGDELKFIRGANTICTGKDTFTITQSGIEMGTAMLYFDSPTRWYRTPCCSAVGNNFFEFDDASAPGLVLQTLTNGQQGQRITIICSDDISKVEDEALGGNINLNDAAGDFDCSVVGVGSTLELIYFDNAEHDWDFHELGRSIN